MKPGRSCVMSIHLQNDSVKNRGFGTQAEVLALQYAFHEMKMETVCADAIKKNQRSWHVLEKVGFRITHQDDGFVYSRYDRDSWTPPILEKPAEKRRKTGVFRPKQALAHILSLL